MPASCFSAATERARLACSLGLADTHTDTLVVLAQHRAARHGGKLVKRLYVQIGFAIGAQHVTCPSDTWDALYGYILVR